MCVYKILCRLRHFDDGTDRSRWHLFRSECRDRFYIYINYTPPLPHYSNHSAMAMALRSGVESRTETESACVLKSVSNLAPPTGLHATADSHIYIYSRSEENTACCSKTIHRLDAHSDKRTHGMHTFCLALHATSASAISF